MDRDLLGWLVVSALVLFGLGWFGWRFFYAGPSGEAASSTPKAPKKVKEAKEGPGWKDRWGILWADLCHWGSAWRRIRVGAMDRRLVWLLPLAILVPLGLGLFFRARFQLDPLKAAELEREGHIRRSLNPEALVPPPPLPPSFFISVERPDLQTADRDWTRLNGPFQQQLLRMLVALKAKGYEFVLLEGYRSSERQDMLAKMGPSVTRALGGQSRHQYGLAADLAPLKDGRLQLSERDPWSKAAYDALGEEAESAGLRWGGRWSFRDYGHVEVPGRIGAILDLSRRGATEL